MAKVQYMGTGRRKKSIARVILVPGEGKVTINKRDIDQYLGLETLKVVVNQPLVLTGTKDKFDVIVNVNGGGFTGQAGAIRHGISRALLKADESLRPELKKAGFLTRDPRMKERKKYGLRIYEKDMYLLAKYMVKDEELVKDAVQDTILRVYERIEYLKNDDSFKFWLLKILGNKCRDILKNDKNIIYLDVQIEEGYRDKGYDEIEIKSCIEKLNESQREIITLYYFNELTYKEISEIMNIPEGTVKSKLSRAKEYLGNIINEEERKINEIRRNIK